MKKLCCIAVFFVVLFTASCSPYERVKGVHLQLQDPAIRQRYGGEMGALADELKQAGVTMVISPVLEGATAYYPSDLLPQSWEYGTQLLAFRHELRRRNIRFAAYVPVFKDAYTQRSQPVLQAVNDYGAGVRGWVCPSRPEYRSYKLQIINEIMLIIQPDALCLEDLYFPVEDTPFCTIPVRNNIRTSCYCNNCLEQFSLYAGITFPENASTAEAAGIIAGNYAREWALWRSNLLTGYIENIYREVRDFDPQCRIMLQVIPIPGQEPDSTRRRIFGLDYKTLYPFVDTFILRSCSADGAGNGDPLLRDIREIQAAGKNILPLFEVRNYLRSGEDAFRTNLQLYPGNILVYDWGQLLNNRHFLNIFISEP